MPEWDATASWHRVSSSRANQKGHRERMQVNGPEVEPER
jgi:hypothetical protein